MNQNLFQGRSLFLMLVLALAGTACNNQDKPDKPQDPRLEKLELQDGFSADHIYSPSENGNGSWVSMTFDHKGRMIASDQRGGLYRLELPPIGSDSTVKAKVEKLDMPELQDTKEGKVQIGYAHGLLWAFNSLYVMVNHRADENSARGSGLYRVQDTDGDDSFDKITLIKELNGEGEHGPHSVVMAPDSVSLYVIAGNHTDLPEMD
ncbi:MAG TPA: heme-binding protein, partial [Anseongella sp.]|nr:heme-binding protein [Anseongella sp.]